MNNTNPIPPQSNFLQNLDEPFPKPPPHYIQDNLIPPNLELITQMINPEYYSFGKKYRFIEDTTDQSKITRNFDKLQISDFKMELKKLNKSIVYKVIELFEHSSKGTENLQDILNDIIKLIKKFYKLTTFIKHNVQSKEDMIEVLKNEIKLIDENREKLINGLKQIQKDLEE